MKEKSISYKTAKQETERLICEIEEITITHRAYTAECLRRVLKENEKINSLIRKLKKDSKERQWIQTADDEYLAYTEKAMYADELLSFLRGEE